MGMHYVARRRQITAKGRTMVLRRRLAANGTPVAVTLTGFTRIYRPEQIQGGIQQGDESVSIMPDEMAAADWPVPPRQGDEMVIDGMVWLIQGVMPSYEGKAVIGYDIWVRGGR